MTQTHLAERAATIEDAVDLGEAALIGVFGTTEARRALVRSARGRVSSVGVGDRLLGGRVLRIEADALVIVRREGEVALALPDGG